MAAVLTLLLFLLYRSGVGKARPVATEIATAPRGGPAARGWMCRRRPPDSAKPSAARFKSSASGSARRSRRRKIHADGIESEFKQRAEAKLARQGPRALAKNARPCSGPGSRRLNRPAMPASDRLTGDAVSRQRARVVSREADLSALAAEESRRWDDLEAAWKKSIIPLYEAVEKMNAVADAGFPALDGNLVAELAPGRGVFARRHLRASPFGPGAARRTPAQGSEACPAGFIPDFAPAFARVSATGLAAL